MAIPRREHTATLLPNGKVLVAGGTNEQPFHQLLDSAELYDPTTCNWTLTEAMTMDRVAHTATLLPNGLVLVAGGQVALPNIPTRSAELYDPATGMWTPTGSMQTPRFLHSATLLPNGQVLIAGGTIGGGAALASAELYDPTTGTFTPTGPLNIARAGHAATLLPDGQVLVTGGERLVAGQPSLASAELYNPATQTFRVTGSMNEARQHHRATLLPDGQVLVAGGSDFTVYLASAELFGPGPRPCVLPVTIDIKPGSDPNSINLGSGGTVPVAIFSTVDFDATTVNPTTVTLASAQVKLKGQGTPMAAFEDVDGDGLVDLVVHVETSAFKLSETDKQAILEGQTSDGTPIRGMDTVRVVP